MDNRSITNTYQFRGIEYVVCLCHDEGDAFTIEVEDKSTADQWRGNFDASYIEDLTHKTGNFKQFQIFVSMLESAITQTSDTVSLDLLTYTDLESLRNKKTGVGTKSSHPGRSSNLNSKRYLILTYTVEFDRIHYPLPLPYMGKPDPRALQETIRELREENKRLRHDGTKDFKHKEMEKLAKEYDVLLQEKEDLEADFIDFKRQVHNTTKGAAAKEIRVLKGMVKHLEQELLTERTKQQRKASKLNQDYRKTFDELEELRASERNLRVRVKSLTNELNVYKRGRSATRTSANNSASSRTSGRDQPFRSSLVRDRSSSRENSLTRGGGKYSRENSLTRTSGRLSRDNSLTRNAGRLSRDASRLSAASRDNSLTRPRTLNSQRERSASRGRLGIDSTRDRSSSRERPTGPTGYHNSRERGRTYMRETASSRERGLTSTTRGRSNSRDRSYTSTGSRHRSPSPASLAGGARSPRFDPTAFIKEKERKRKESELKQKRQSKSKNYTRSKRPSSVSSLRSRSSSIDSLSDIGLDTDASESRLNRVAKSSRSPYTSAVSSPESVSGKPSITKGTKILASTPDNPKFRTKSRTGENGSKTTNGGVFYDRSEEISEIDERLNRLQQFMKQNLQ